MVKSMLISASRRTDIPAFYGQWLVNRLREKYVLVRNPMNPRQVSRISLDPGGVDCIVFWTKDPKNFLPYLDDVDRLGFRCYFQFTLTPYGPDIEPGLPGKGEIVNTFVELSRRIGKEKVIWRYDPVILNEVYSPEYHAAAFEGLCMDLRAYTEKCIISFIDSYSFLGEAFRNFGIRELSGGEINELAGRLASIAKRHDLPLVSCAEKTDLQKYGVFPNRCVDAGLVEHLFGIPVKHKKDPSQRVHCGCSVSRDIGAYNTCLHGCVYCYARRGKAAPCDPLSPLLCDKLDGTETIVDAR
jgi:hypothetical protein